jgi:hypothetical protein
LIDLIITNNPTNIIDSGVGDPITNSRRYHCPIHATLNFPKITGICYTRKVWKYDIGNYQALRTKLNNIDWESVINLNYVDDIAKLVTGHLIEAAQTTIPNKLATIRNSDPPWIHNEIQTPIRKRKRAHKIAKLKNTHLLWENFRRLRNKVTTTIRRAKSQHVQKEINTIHNSETNKRDWWKLVKSLMGQKVNRVFRHFSTTMNTSLMITPKPMFLTIIFVNSPLLMKVLLVYPHCPVCLKTN